jgi:hypothetical protein
MPSPYFQFPDHDLVIIDVEFSLLHSENDEHSNEVSRYGKVILAVSFCKMIVPIKLIEWTPSVISDIPE